MLHRKICLNTICRVPHSQTEPRREKKKRKGGQIGRALKSWNNSEIAIVFIILSFLLCIFLYQSVIVCSQFSLQATGGKNSDSALYLPRLMGTHSLCSSSIQRLSISKKAVQHAAWQATLSSKRIRSFTTPADMASALFYKEDMA